MQQMLTVGQVARQAGVTSKTVRYYEEIGLLPEGIRAPNGYRNFRIDTVNRLKFIQRAKTLGLTLEEIRNLCSIAEHGRCEMIKTELKDIVDQKIAGCNDQIHELLIVRDMLQTASQQLEASGSHQGNESEPHHPAFSPDCTCVPNPA